MGIPILTFSTNNKIIIGNSDIGLSNSISSIKPINLQSTNLLNNTPEDGVNGKAQLIFTDSEDNTIGWFGEHFFSNEYQAISMFAQRNIDNIDYFNGFYLGINSSGKPVNTMHNKECIKAWRTALAPDVLFNTTSLTNAFPITLSSSAANYNHMRIYYSNSNVVSSVDVFNPNGKMIDLFFGGTANNGGIYWPQATQIQITGTQIIIAGTDNKYYMDTASSTTTTRTTTLRSTIYIYRVEAW